MKIETKYSKGDTVYFMHMNEICKTEIVGITYQEIESGTHELYDLLLKNSAGGISDIRLSVNALFKSNYDILMHLSADKKQKL